MDIYLAGCQGNWSIIVTCKISLPVRCFIQSVIKICGLCIVFTQALVVEQLERGGFFSDVITEGRVFATVHDAVLYCLKHRGAVTIHSYENALVGFICTVYVLITLKYTWNMIME